MAPEVVIIEHHHSRSDPLPMKTVFKNIKPNFATTRTYESDSGSASSLYAKINPKLKAKLPILEKLQMINNDIISDSCDEREMSTPTQESIYGKIPKMTTFGVDQKHDINVTCREPTVVVENISPEEALKTIRRRNYPKVLPDIEKRLSLPAPNSLFLSQQFGTSMMDHRKGPHPSCIGGCPPKPPPRLFGPSKSLDLTEEDEEPITTNLHVGPLLKRQDSVGKNRTDSSSINSIERLTVDPDQVMSNQQMECSEITNDSIVLNPKCPVHGTRFYYPDETINTACTSRSADNLDRNINNHDWIVKLNDSSVTTHKMPNMSLPDVSFGNPNWFKTMRKGKVNQNIFGQYNNSDNTIVQTLNENVNDETNISMTSKVPEIYSNLHSTIPQNVVSQKPKIIITQMVPQPGKIQPENQLASSNEDSRFPPVSPEITESLINICSGDKKECKIIIAPTGSNLKQPKIIIKPTINLQKNRERNIPKVSAIPSPDVHNVHLAEPLAQGIDTVDSGSEKPPIKEKPSVIKIPSFSQRTNQRIVSPEKNLIKKKLAN